ncbi:ABC transporter permease [Actinomadura macra]|uniref:ABC transporter permease n=1 Tax=Actinomadura macra TaxID=46164 RepID=UPI00082DE398|nr:ABC transporter permease [Actinomadura macra]
MGLTTVPRPTWPAVLPRRRRRAGTAPPGVWVAAAVLALIAVAVVWPDLLATHPPDRGDPADALAPPGLDHLFGTDQLGRDVYSRVVHGARPSLTIGLGATGIAVLAGSLLGVLAAAGGRVLDELIMRVSDVFLAFPGLLLSLLIVAVLGTGTLNATLAIGASLVPGFVRLARGQALIVRNSDYVRTAVTLGQRRAAILGRHVLPNALPPLLVLAMINVGTAVIAGSSLSFLGLGPKPPTPEWGAMLSEGRDFLGIAWALAVFPGLAVTSTVLAVNVVGRWLQRRFEGRLPRVERSGR